MWRFNVREHNSGFTLIEALVVVTMVGILSSIAAPGLLGLYARTRINASLNEVQSALSEGQRQAIRSSRSCNVTIDPSSQLVMGSCLVTGNRRLSNVAIRSSVSALRFNIKGAVSNSNNTAINQPITVVVSSPNSRLQRCLVMSVPLGLIRTGTYNGTDTVDSNCLP